MVSQQTSQLPSQSNSDLVIVYQIEIRLEGARKLADAVNIYEPIDVTLPTIPPRSRLFRLEPVGIGTPYAESLTSYVARLAQAHQVAPKSLVRYEILPFQGKEGRTLRHYYRLNKFWLVGALSLNGAGPAAQEWVQTLQALTLRNDLRFSTMLTWGEVIASSRLLRGSKAWCPSCYEAWKHTDHVIYEPLLWTIQGVTVCPVHHCYLSTECPHKDCKSQESLLTQVSRPGYCSHCTRWLGLPSACSSSLLCKRRDLFTTKMVAHPLDDLLSGE